jgi:hypothetical protein
VAVLQLVGIWPVDVVPLLAPFIFSTKIIKTCALILELPVCRNQAFFTVKDFVYLGSNQSANGGEDIEIERKIGQANRVSFSLVLSMRSGVIHRETEIRLYKTAIRSVLWYVSESWAFDKKSESALLAFERKVLRRLCWSHPH